MKCDHIIIVHITSTKQISFRDDKVRPKILRIFKIWEQRSVYDDEFLSDLTGLLSAGGAKKTDDDSGEFQVRFSELD